jgi:putative methionine-R-sulfoxide reductase with GAF domain
MKEHSLATGSSLAFEESAIDVSTAALKEVSEKLIKQYALDVSKQVEIYLATHFPLAAEKISRDPTLAEIAFQPVGRTGYTALYEQETGIMRFHSNRSLIDFDMHGWSEKLPSWWKIYGTSLDGSSIGGYYEWEDADGKIRPKYMYCVPVRGRSLVIAATIYLIEFLKPCRDVQSKLAFLGREVKERTAVDWRRAERLQAINDISRRISSMLDLDEIFPYAVKCIQDTFQYRSVSIFLLDSGNIVLKAGARGYRGVVSMEFLVKADEDVAKQVVQTGKALVVNDVSQESKHHLAGDDIQSRLLAPMKIVNEVLGVLEIGSARRDAFDEMDLFTAQTLSS